MRRFLLASIAVIATLSGTNPSGAVEPAATTKTAIFAGGCFWCMQPPYDRAKGVIKTVVGYTGGSEADANYEKVSAHQTKHRESIEVTYDSEQLSYHQLIDMFLTMIKAHCDVV